MEYLTNKHWGWYLQMEYTSIVAGISNENVIPN